MIDYGYAQSELCWGESVNLAETDVRRILQGIKDAGGSRVRMGVQLGTVAELDRAVTLCVEYGIRPLLCLVNNPDFGYANTVDSFGTFAGNVAVRYGPSGVGELHNSVLEIELFNEPNSSLNPPSVTPDIFVKYLQAGYQAIKAVHPSCTVIAGGTIPAPDTWIPFIGVAANPLNWYTQVYAAGGGQWFDALAMHLYTDGPPSPTMPQWQYITDVRALMVAKGDDAKKIWITEVGVGFPQSGDPTIVQVRDWLKIMVEGIEAMTFAGPFYIYQWHNSTANTSDPNSAYGMVNFDYSPKTPVFEYAITIAGTISGPDVTPPSNPTGLMYSDVTSTSATFTWNPNPSVDGVTNYRLKTLAGVQLADTQDTHYTATGLPSGTPQSFIVTAVDAAGNESAASNVASLTTSTPTGSQGSFTVLFSGSTVPTVLSQLGLGFGVAAGVATPNAASVDGAYVTVAPYISPMQSPDHSSRVTLAGVAAGADRTALAIVRAKSDGTEWVAAASPGGGSADSLVILKCVAGKVTPVKAMDTTPAGAGSDLLITVTGGIYTARIVNAASVVTAELIWADVADSFPGSTNRFAGLGWRHLRSKSINYPPPGITKWTATDVGPITPAGGFDLWMLGVTDSEDDWGLLLATGLWEAII